MGYRKACEVIDLVAWLALSTVGSWHRPGCKASAGRWEAHEVIDLVAWPALSAVYSWHTAGYKASMGHRKPYKVIDLSSLLGTSPLHNTWVSCRAGTGLAETVYEISKAYILASEGTA